MPMQKILKMDITLQGGHEIWDEFMINSACLNIASQDR